MAQTDNELLDVTECAAAKLRQICFCQGRAGTGMRIQVLYVAGCTGPAYYIGLEETAQPGDILCYHGDITLYVDPDSAAIVRGGVLDYRVTPEEEGFVVQLPSPIEGPCGKCVECTLVKPGD